VLLLSGKNIQVDTHFDIVFEIRKKIGEEIGICLQDEFNDAIEEDSAHMLAFVGDNPIGIGRIRFERSFSQSLPTEIVTVILDKFAILPAYRQRGYFKLCLQHIFTELFIPIGMKDHANKLKTIQTVTSNILHNSDNSLHHIQQVSCIIPSQYFSLFHSLLKKLEDLQVSMSSSYVNMIKSDGVALFTMHSIHISLQNMNITALLHQLQLIHPSIT